MPVSIVCIYQIYGLPTFRILELVPMTNPAWSKFVTHAVSFGGLPFDRGVPAKERFIIALRFGSKEPNSRGVICVDRSAENQL